MKLHRVLLFTTLEMNVTPVGEDLHILLTNADCPGIGCTAMSVPLPDTDPPECSTTVIESWDHAESLFCIYVAEEMAKVTGQRVLCTGGVFVDNPNAHDLGKLYENIDEMIRDWSVFFTEDD